MLKYISMSDIFLWYFQTPIIVALETQSSKVPVCPKGGFKCAIDGNCIGNLVLCDGHADCLDGSDEAETFCGRITVLMMANCIRWSVEQL